MPESAASTLSRAPATSDVWQAAILRPDVQSPPLGPPPMWDDDHFRLPDLETPESAPPSPSHAPAPSDARQSPALGQHTQSAPREAASPSGATDAAPLPERSNAHQTPMPDRQQATPADGGSASGEGNTASEQRAQPATFSPWTAGPIVAPPEPREERQAASAGPQDKTPTDGDSSSQAADARAAKDSQRSAPKADRLVPPRSFSGVTLADMGKAKPAPTAKQGAASAAADTAPQAASAPPAKDGPRSAPKTHRLVPAAALRPAGPADAGQAKPAPAGPSPSPPPATSDAPQSSLLPRTRSPRLAKRLRMLLRPHLRRAPRCGSAAGAGQATSCLCWPKQRFRRRRRCVRTAGTSCEIQPVGCCSDRRFSCARRGAPSPISRAAGRNVGGWR